MKKISAKGSLGAFTLIELLVVVIILAVFVALAFPLRDHGVGKAKAVACLNNLKQIGVGMMMFAGDYTNRYPWQVSATNGGSAELVPTGSPAPHFKTITNYDKRLPSLLLCPADKTRRPEQFPPRTINDSNISYFVNVDASAGSGGRNTDVLLAGDRNLEVAGKLLKSGLFAVSPKMPLGWGSGLHTETGKYRRGAVLFADGHIELTTSNSLMALSNRLIGTNRLAIP